LGERRVVASIKVVDTSHLPKTMTSSVPFMGSRPTILPCAPVSIAVPSVYVSRHVQAVPTVGSNAKVIDASAATKQHNAMATTAVPVMGSRPTILRCQPNSSAKLPQFGDSTLHATSSVHIGTCNAKAPEAVPARKHVHWTETVSTRRFDQEGLLEENQTQIVFRSRQPEAWRRFVIRPVQRLARVVADATTEDPSTPQAPHHEKQASFRTPNFAWVLCV
jgi:hypothetical protein